MTPETLVNNTLDVSGNTALTSMLDVLHDEGLIEPIVHSEATEYTLEESVSDVSPTVALHAASLQASLLAEAGATMDIRYAGKKVTEAISRLLGHLERHRQLVGEPR